MTEQTDNILIDSALERIKKLEKDLIPLAVEREVNDPQEFRIEVRDSISDLRHELSDQIYKLKNQLHFTWLVIWVLFLAFLVICLPND
ncbi:MAG: hypothetical protein AB2754_15990 [Candidatus Thiodiazotropha endolucinida]